MQKAVQLKITLLDIKPLIWRQILIKDSSTLNDLHEVIQGVMPWEDLHLFEFKYAGTSTSTRTMDNELTLSALNLKEKDLFLYIYDFGDHWEHEILVEKIVDIEPKRIYPICTNAKRACPPENCGGAFSYLSMLRILKDLKHPEYENTAEHLGDSFSPEHVDLVELNQNLQIALS